MASACSACRRARSSSSPPACCCSPWRSTRWPPRGGPAPAEPECGPVRYADGPRVSETLMRWGILSTANINAKLIAGARDAGVELLAVGSRDSARGRAFADRFGIPRVHASYEALLADGD